MACRVAALAAQGERDGVFISVPAEQTPLGLSLVKPKTASKIRAAQAVLAQIFSDLMLENACKDKGQPSLSQKVEQWQYF